MVSDQNDGFILIRRALQKFEPAELLASVDQLNLSPTGRVDVVILAALRNLHRGRAVSNFVTNAPMSAVRFLAELLSHEVLDRVVELLGDAASDPTFEQLSDAVDVAVGEGFSIAAIALTLALAAANGVPAEAHCRRLLAERPELELAQLANVPSSTGVKEKQVDPEIREQRRRRKQEERAARQRSQLRSAAPLRRTKSPGAVKSSLSTPPRTPQVDAIVHRRETLLTPFEAEKFAIDHPLVGSLVEVEVGFDALDVRDPTSSSKARPAVVIAGSATALLVRPVYSRPTSERVLLAGWSRLGLDHPSYVGAERVRIDLESATPLRRFGRLNDTEWNAIS